jgi:hypothetical protein
MEQTLPSREKIVQSSIDFWQNEPLDYFYKRLRINTHWDGEAAMLQAVILAIREGKKRVVVSSGHSLGKDYIGGGLVPYFLEIWGPCIVITTAPTNRQVKNVMWAEIERHYTRIEEEPPGKLLSLQINVAPKWYALGFTTKETGSMVGKFQGFHAERVFVIASEAQAIPDDVYTQIDAILTGQNALLIMIGNPLRTTGQFAKAIRNRKDNIVLELSCLDNPNYKEKRAVVPGLASYEWVEDKRKNWGPDDPRWISRVLGQLPLTSIDTIFSHNLVEKMIGRETFEANVFKGVGLDIAHFGDDETVIYGGTNGKVEDSMIYAGEQTDVTAARAVVMLNKVGGNFICGDTGGLGVGTFDTLRTMQGKTGLKGVHINAVNSASKPGDDQYANLKAEMWFIVLARAIRGDTSMPNDPLLIEELTEMKYFINKQGKIQIESKEDVKERLGRSPNRADAWILYQYGMEKATRINKEKYQEDAEMSGEITSSVAGLGGMAG